MNIRALALVVSILILFQSIKCFSQQMKNMTKLFKEPRDVKKDIDKFKQFLTRLRSFFDIRHDRFDKRTRKLKEAFEAFRAKLTEDDDKRLLRLGASMKKGAVSVLNVSLTLPPEINHSIDPILDAGQMIAADGYIAKTHNVITKDGYLLTIHRILAKKRKHSAERRVVLMHHGLFGSSDDWLLIGKNKALPYLLTDNGYDVWLLNARGNKYSKFHSTKNVADQKFWDFTFHEIGVYDLPAAIDYVSHIKGSAEIHYIGHSLGSTALLVLLSTLPEYNSKLRSAIFLAPLVFMYHVRGPMTVLSHLYKKKVFSLIRSLGKTEFSRNTSFPRPFSTSFCEGTAKLCSNPLLLLCNGGRKTVSDSLMESILDHVPGGGSVKTLVHYMQLVQSGFFQAFDYGRNKNIKKYGELNAPAYNLRKVTIPIALFSSPSDWLSTELDIETLLPLLKDVTVHHVVRSGNFDHLDFLWSPDVPELLYDFVLTALEKNVLGPESDDFF